MGGSNEIPFTFQIKFLEDYNIYANQCQKQPKQTSSVSLKISAQSHASKNPLKYP